MLERALDRPLINLGFSGTGKLERPVIDLISEIDAKVYVLDCLPNLSSGLPGSEVADRIRESVRVLQEKHPSVPILLVEHSGGSAGHHIDTARRHEFQRVNGVLQETFARMKAEGVGNIYLLTSKEIGLDINSTVDGVHPNDIGMEQYAAAYERSIRAILHEPADIHRPPGRVQVKVGTKTVHRNKYDMLCTLGKAPAAQQQAHQTNKNTTHISNLFFYMSSLCGYYSTDKGQP